MQQEIEDIRINLRHKIIPKIVLGEYVSYWWLTRLDVLHRYAINILTVLGGIAVSAPVQEWLSAAGRIGGPAAPDKPPVVIPALDNPANLAAAALLVIWAVLTLIVREEAVSKKATLARSFQHAMEIAEGRLDAILSEKDPIDSLNKLFLDNIKPNFERMTEEGALPHPSKMWKRKREKYENAVNAKFTDIINKYQQVWKPTPHPSGEAVVHNQQGAA